MVKRCLIIGMTDSFTSATRPDRGLPVYAAFLRVQMLRVYLFCSCVHACVRSSRRSFFHFAPFYTILLGRFEPFSPLSFHPPFWHAHFCQSLMISICVVTVTGFYFNLLSHINIPVQYLAIRRFASSFSSLCLIFSTVNIFFVGNLSALSVFHLRLSSFLRFCPSDTRGLNSKCDDNLMLVSRE